METMAAFGSSFSALSKDWGSQVDISRFGSKPVLSKAWIQQTPLVSRRPFGNRKVSQKRSAIRASIRSSDYGSSSSASIAPLQLDSPVGQFLSQMLMSYPHLVPAAVEQQLEQLQTDRSAENDKEEPSVSGSEPLLYRIIAEVKAHERGKALEDILYTLVVQKFKDANAPLIPNISPSSPSGRVDTLPNEQGKLVQLHSPESYEMIKDHLSFILGDSDSNTIAELNKAKIGQVYAASAIYGYFLKRVDQRYQLDNKMKIMPNGIGNDDFYNQEVISGVKSSRLKNYVMSFDRETLQRYAKIRSKEAVSIIEKHTETLFGRAKVAVTPQGTSDSSKDENIDISFDDFRRLVLEALTFGSFLWDAETYADLRYHFVANRA